MKVWVCRDQDDLGRRAASQVAFLVREAVAANGSAVVALSAGVALAETLAALAAEPDVDWAKVELFHLGEFVGLRADHPGSTRRFLRERLVDQLPTPAAAFHAIAGDADDPAAEGGRLDALLGGRPIDVLLCAIGQAGHLGFNGPADDEADANAGTGTGTGAGAGADTDAPIDPEAIGYRVVALDDDARQEQADEGWFPKRGKVPKQAIAMALGRLLSADAVVCCAPGERLAEAVAAALEGPASPGMPASLLQRHPNVAVFLDRESGKQLE